MNCHFPLFIGLLSTFSNWRSTRGSSISIRWILISLLLVLPTGSNGYNFKLENSSFSGKGLIGDFGDFNNSGNMNFATYLYNAKTGKTTIYIYSDIKKEDPDPVREFEVEGECDGLSAADFDSNSLLDILLVMKYNPSSPLDNTKNNAHLNPSSTTSGNEEDSGKRYYNHDILNRVRSALNPLSTGNNNRQLYYYLIYYQEKDLFVKKWDSRLSPQVPFNSLDDPVHDVNVYEKSVLAPGSYELSSIHPIVADFDGDGKFDLLAQTSDDRIFFWFNQNQVFMPMLATKTMHMGFNSEIDGYIPNPHSSAFVDMDGDCRPDLVLVVQGKDGPHIEIFLTSVSEDKLIYTKWESVVELPPNYGMITIDDFDSDGTNDILVPFCDSVDEHGYCVTQCKIAIVYNEQIPFCPQMIRSSEQECRHPDNLCTHSDMKFTPLANSVVLLDKKYKFINPLMSNNVTYQFGPSTTGGANDVRSYRYLPYYRETDLSGLSGIKKDASVSNFKKVPTQLATVSVADLNNDSKLDFIVPLYYFGDDDGGGRAEATDLKYCILVVKKSDRGDEFTKIDLSEDAGILVNVATADVVDKRMLTLMVFSKVGEALKCSYYSLYKENIDLFMKVMTKYKNIDESKYPENYFLSGSNNYGLTYKLTVIDINGIKSTRIATLRPQTAYTPLYTPFTFIGLGKTNNYVEELYLGLSSCHKNYHHMWISIIPSCTVITLPIPLQTPSQWVLKLSIIPAKKLFTILLSTGIALVIFGLVILIFDLKEKREDFIQAKGFRQKFIIN